MVGKAEGCFYLALLLHPAHAVTTISRAYHGGVSHRGAILRSSWQELRANKANHAREVAESEQLGYEPIRSLPPPPWQPPATWAWDVPLAATGMGPVCPFAFSQSAEAASMPLVFETAAPLFQPHECDEIVHEARAHLAAGRAGSTFSFNDTCRNIAVADMPRTLAWLNAEGAPRAAALAGACFGADAIGDASDLRVYRALVVQYDAAAGLTHQTAHRDHALVTCVVTLNPRHEYDGGGTWLEALGGARAPLQGHALLQASALRHAGHAITRGERWVLVLFLQSAAMRYGEHVRHFSARAQRLLAAGDDAGAMRFVHLARAMCADADPELKAYAIERARGGESLPAVSMREQSPGT